MFVHDSFDCSHILNELRMSFRSNHKVQPVDEGQTYSKSFKRRLCDWGWIHPSWNVVTILELFLCKVFLVFWNQ